MAAVNENMFDASVAADRPGGASLMVLPLNLIAQIVSNVSFFCPGESQMMRNTDSSNYHRSMIPPTSPGFAGHVVSSIIWRCRSFTAA